MTTTTRKPTENAQARGAQPRGAQPQGMQPGPQPGGAPQRKPRKRYDETFKRQAVDLLAEGGRTQQTLAKELGVSSAALGQWRGRYGVGAAEVRADRSEADPVAAAAAAELAQLRRELAHVARQRDILKKALSIFSQEHPCFTT